MGNLHTMPRRILPERVLGQAPTTSAALKLATEPMRPCTSATTSSSISPGDRSTPALSTNTPSRGCPSFPLSPFFGAGGIDEALRCKVSLAEGETIYEWAQ